MKVYAKDVGEAVGLLMAIRDGRMNGGKRTVYSALMRQELENGQHTTFRSYPDNGVLGLARYSADEGLLEIIEIEHGQLCPYLPVAEEQKPTGKRGLHTKK